MTARFFAGLALSFVVAGALAADPTKSVQPIKIGVTTSLTGSLANFGVEQQRGMQMWVADINDRGALLGRPVQLVLYDDGRRDSATQLYQKLINTDKVDFDQSVFVESDSGGDCRRGTGGRADGHRRVGIGLWNHGYKNIFGLYRQPTREHGSRSNSPNSNSSKPSHSSISTTISRGILPTASEPRRPRAACPWLSISNIPVISTQCRRSRPAWRAPIRTSSLSAVTWMTASRLRTRQRLRGSSRS
jgi:hypothetical protein